MSYPSGQAGDQAGGGISLQKTVKIVLKLKARNKRMSALSMYIEENIDDVNFYFMEKDENMSEETIPLNAFLVIEGGSTIPLNKPEITIGRKNDNQIVLDDPRVSRYHAKICLIKDHFVIFDLNSSGGTYVNSQRIEQGVLYSGDVISFGGCNLAFLQGSMLAKRGNVMSPSPASGERNTVVLNTDRFDKSKGGVL